MNRTILITIIFTCVYAIAYTQVNFVKNPSFEKLIKCPNEWNQINQSEFWTCAVDTTGEPRYAPEYYNKCAGSDLDAGVPNNLAAFQYPHSGDAYVGAHLYYDNPPPFPSGLSTNWRDYTQGRLFKPLVAGQAYCVSFWVVMAEVSAYGHNSIGAYLDDGNINKRSPAGDMITDVVPQVASTSVIKDTMNWIKIQGSFVASGNETHITLGNFAKQEDVDTSSDFGYYTPMIQYSYFLIDDVSIVPIDLDADAGKDTWVEMGKQVQIGRVGDTTAEGLDCKWYKKGVLIDSGAIITVSANAIKNAVDTYVVVQTICGFVKTDTVTVKTAGLGVNEYGFGTSFIVYPNPSNGAITISYSLTPQGAITAKVYDLLGRIVHQEQLTFNSKETGVNLNAPNGSYILELKDEAGNVQRERIVIE